MTALLAGALTSSAAVTVQGWWHLDSTQPIADSSGNNRSFGSAYSTAPATGGAVAALLVNNGAGGPLGSSGWTSTQCIQLGVGVGGKRQSAMWGIGYNPPAQDYGIEIWAMPQDNGIAGGSGGWILSSGQSGGVALRINAPSGSPSYIDAYILGTGVTIGNQAPIDTNRWTHLAIVNAGGVLTFYTNGIACGASVTSGATAPAGDVYLGTPSDNQAYYGYLDEARMFTFAPGAFSTSDLLLRAAGPNIAVQPQSATVWTNGAVGFTVVASFDSSVTYQWWTNGVAFTGATGPSVYVPVVTPAYDGRNFSCVLKSGGISVTSTVASLKVVAPNVSNVNAYRNAILAESSLAGYYPVDNCTGSTLSNLVSAPSPYDGTLELGAWYDGRTNTSFGQRALFLELNGDVTIPNNPVYDFVTGFGTIEGLIYLDQAPGSDPTIFSQGYDGIGSNYALRATKNGSGLVFIGAMETVTWTAGASLLGRLAHVALVLDNGTNVTAYADGQSLGTQVIPSGIDLAYVGGSGWIGAMGTSVTADRWSGTIDELAIYSSALSQNTIQSHYTKFFYGTNTAAPAIVSQSASKVLYAGASPTLVVTASGTLPLSYQWTSNNVPIPGATTPTLTLTRATTAASANYQLTVQNQFGTTNTQPIALSFVAPPTGYPSMVMNDGPAAYWRLNESAGPTLTDYAGENNGTYTGSGVTYGAPSFQGETAAVTLNGSSGRGIVPYTRILNPSAPFSIEFWAKPNAYVPGSTWTVPFSSMNRPARDGGYEFYMGGNYNGFEFHTAAGGGYNMLTGDGTTATPPNWYHVVGIYDGTNIYCYVNGQPASVNPSDNNILEGTPPFAPNTVVPVYIGSRSDNARYYSGSLADFAFYNYALSFEQVSNHWSIMYNPAKVVTPPAGITNVEGSTITLTSVFSGLPNTYQWYKDGSALTTAYNPVDNTLHYSQDVTNLGLTITETTPADSGLYHVVASNPLGGAQTVDVHVLITPDTNAPVVTSVKALGTPNLSGGPSPYLVKVTFNKRVDQNSANIPGNYVINAISGSVSVKEATLRGDLVALTFASDWRTAFLQTSGLTPGQKYTLTVSGVKDQAATPNTIAAAPVSFWAPPLVHGVLWWDYYYEINPQGVGNLQSSPLYPNAPSTNWFMTAFDTHQITGTSGDLNNNPAFGALGDNYGDCLSGWITPTVTGDYTFFLASDDASELDLSTDGTVANAQPIAVETSCCHGFLDTTNVTLPPQTSTPQHLVANTPYFIRALHTEGGGGDFVKVAWRLSTDPTPAVNLTPISAQYLSAFALLPPTFNAPVFNNNQLTISWNNPATLLQSTDLKTWTPVATNPTSPFQVTVNPATPHIFYRLQQ